jgi:multidrug efflux pump subunit AcrA (membrane-fusion protein)
VPNPGERLKIGALVDVGIEEARVDSSIVIARSAVFEKDGRKIVFVHTTPEHFEAREIELLEGVGPRAAVRRGLAPGDRVVVAGGYSLLSAPVAARTR